MRNSQYEMSICQKSYARVTKTVYVWFGFLCIRRYFTKQGGIEHTPCTGQWCFLKVCLSFWPKILGTYICILSQVALQTGVQVLSRSKANLIFSYYKEEKHKETKAKATLKVANTMTYLFYVTPNYSQSFMLLFLSVNNWWVQPKSLYISRAVRHL